MSTIGRILVIQTAFIGDVILTLPLLQVLKKSFVGSKTDLVVVPRAADVCANHPAIDEIILFDKRGKDSGLSGLRKLGRRLRERKYDLVIVPHRSLRSAILAFMTGSPIRVGFNRSVGRFLFTKLARYRKDYHEVDRNISLLEGVGIREAAKVLPSVFPTEEDKKKVDRLLSEFSIQTPSKMVTLAPGTIWNTKRWPKEHFAVLAELLGKDGFEIMLIGGTDDAPLCTEIQQLAASRHLHTAAGRLSLLQSAEMIRRSKVLISNDSAPMHLGVAVQTPVIGIFGATIPAFGFAPYGYNDVILETNGLPCRPCSSHGGDRCPIGTFECMRAIKPDRVMTALLKVIEKNPQASSVRI